MNDGGDAGDPKQPPGQPPGQPSEGMRFMLQEYWVDFLGGLLPGTLFLAASIIALTPILTVCFSIASMNFSLTYFGLIAAALRATENTPSVIWFALGTAFIVLSFVLGHLFYRQDPKVPNQESFALLVRYAEKAILEEMKKRAGETSVGKPSKQEIDSFVQKHFDCENFDGYLKKEYACTSEDDCQFPFPFFDHYLEKRGMNHLVSLVLWRDDPSYRSKNWINILKIRLKHHFPNRCSTIIRNEAHVRLASSTWYVGRAICCCCNYAWGVLLASAVICGVVLYAEAGFEGSQINTSMLPNIVSNYTLAVLLLLLVHYTGRFAMARIENFLHYQRQREVVHVLETSWAAFKEEPNLLNPPFAAFYEEMRCAEKGHCV